jgi:hypothetical protein
MSANTTQTVQYNVAVGENALAVNQASTNTAVGYSALEANTTGFNNTVLGYQAGYSNTTGYESVYIGTQAGDSVTSGVHNVSVGFQAGENTTTGSGNVCVGKAAKPSSATTSDEHVFGTNSTGKGADTGFFRGNNGVYQSNNTTTWTTTSDQRLKKNIVDNNIGLEVINKIQVRNFEYRLPNEITEVLQNQVIQKTGVQLGVIAQELQAVLPECVTEQSTGVLSVDTDNLVWYMVNAIKDLKSQLDSVKAELATLKGA